MIERALAGHIDIILTKSISRFARNTVDLLNTVRALKTAGVSVLFERENIDTANAEGEVLLTLLASFAQAESESISQNAKWGIRLEHPLTGYPKHGVFDGVIPRLKASYLEKANAKTTEKEDAALRRIVKQVPCPHCHGQHINGSARDSRINGLNIAEVSRLSIDDCATFIEGISDKVTHALREEVLARLNNMRDIGLGYLTLGRTLDTLSGGELQRIKLVRFFKEHQWDQKNVLALDEITTGLHPKDVEQMMRFMRHLTTKGVTVIAIDHNLDAIAQADYNIDIGPGAGAQGGTVVFAGTPRGLADCPSFLTRSWLQKTLFSSHIRLTK